MSDRQKAVLSCGHERLVGDVEEVGNVVGCKDCGYKVRVITALPEPYYEGMSEDPGDLRRQFLREAL